MSWEEDFDRMMYMSYSEEFPDYGVEELEEDEEDEEEEIAFRNFMKAIWHTDD